MCSLQKPAVNSFPFKTITPTGHLASTQRTTERKLTSTIQPHREDPFKTFTTKPRISSPINTIMKKLMLTTIQAPEREEKTITMSTTPVFQQSSQTPSTGWALSVASWLDDASTKVYGLIGEPF